MLPPLAQAQMEGLAKQTRQAICGGIPYGDGAFSDVGASAKAVATTGSFSTTFNISKLRRPSPSRRGQDIGEAPAPLHIALPGEF